MEIQQFITENVNYVTFSAGLDASDLDTINNVQKLMESCVEDMILNGVAESNITSKKLALTALVQYVVDNQTSTPGSFAASKAYYANIQKLKYLPVEESVT